MVCENRNFKALRNEDLREEFLDELRANGIQMEDGIQLVPNWELNFLPEGENRESPDLKPVLIFQ